jgi:L-lactate dehydrogenase complex protein LldG
VVAAREAILSRIRHALHDGPQVPDVPRAYRGAGEIPADVERFAERVADYRATVHRAAPDDVDGVIAGLVGARVVGDGADRAAIEAADTVVTGCELAIAETGTIVLAGMRALTLIPDHHVCVVRADQVVANVPDAIARLDPAAPLTFVSGPSATSDIELERVEGVHGPRRLDVVLVG